MRLVSLQALPTLTVTWHAVTSVIPADEISHVHDYGLSELFVPLEEHIVEG
jgi:hypothetical protein